MADSRFVYVTYIRTTQEKLWRALLEPEFTREYWFNCRHESDWAAGAPWRLTTSEGGLVNSGEVVEIEPPRRLVLSWRAEFSPELRAEGPSRQHGMHWVNLDLPPANNSSKGSDAELNRLGFWLGAGAQSNVDQGPDLAPPEADLATARHLGRRVAGVALQLVRGQAESGSAPLATQDERVEPPAATRR